MPAFIKEPDLWSSPAPPLSCCHLFLLLPVRHRPQNWLPSVGRRDEESHCSHDLVHRRLLVLSVKILLVLSVLVLVLSVKIGSRAPQQIVVTLSHKPPIIRREASYFSGIGVEHIGKTILEMCRGQKYKEFPIEFSIYA